MPLWPWFAFLGFLACFLALDLLVLNRKSHEPTLKEATTQTIGWVLLGVVVGLGTWLGWAHMRPASPLSAHEAGMTWFAAWIVEYSLSVDNLFVFILIFQFFKVPNAWQHRVLFWGILGALVLRGLVIGAGAALVAHFGWILYLFGAFLIFTGVKMFRSGDEDHLDPGQHVVMRVLRRILPLTERFDGDRFTTRVEGKFFFTPLFAVLMFLNAIDIVFAVDSIPAVFSLTTDAFLAFTSNMMAVMGLRALYFVLAGAMQAFRFLQTGLAFILTFIGIKMLLPLMEFVLPGHHWHVPIAISLGVIGGVLSVSVAASLLIPAPADEE
ncbi:MAG: TerC family protein [Fibrobacteria bacterium]|nr:TerC family protein [Fibrobacteria bacterium]